ncbi:hypothetical protein YPF_2388 [Yersinia pestis biovar Orientalis str. India 195]|nr:hypothetical protein YPF_2388 [Yersinia pestis biovar Orientalis str. India 195]
MIGFWAIDKNLMISALNINHASGGYHSCLSIHIDSM